MELRIQIQEGFCEYTGQEAQAFVKILRNENDSSGWICMDALQKAVQLLNSVLPKESIQQQGSMSVMQNARPTPSPQIDQDKPVILSPKNASDAEQALLVGVKAACEDLISKCEEMQEPVNEVRIGDIVRRFRKRFRRPEVMAGVFLDVFGLPPNRFKLLLDRPEFKTQVDEE